MTSKVKVWRPVKDDFVYLHETGLIERSELFVRWQGESEEIGVGETNNDALYCPLPANLRLCVASESDAPVPLDMPDGEGYFAFEGRIDGSSVERLQWCVMVRRNSIDKELYVWRFGGQTFKASQMFGKWTRLQMPWQAKPSEEDES
jgi:hypothetical protein